MGSHTPSPQDVPPELVEERVAGWHAFTRFMTLNCVATAAILVLMLLFFKVF